MSYWGARAWVNYLDATNYGGSNQWALPTTVDTSSASDCGASCNFPPAQSSSQMAQLFYGGLGQFANSSITTTHNANYSLFSNVESGIVTGGVYWSGTEYSAAPYYAYDWGTDDGNQGFDLKAGESYALAVSPGDVSAVPEPGAAWLLGVGLLGLVGLRRRKAETSALRSFE
jgi:hypothetical protein